MLKLRNAVLTALLAFCLAMPFVSCSFNDGATGDVSGEVKVQSDNNQNGGNGGSTGGNEKPSGGDEDSGDNGNENPSGGNNGGSGNENPSGGNGGSTGENEKPSGGDEDSGDNGNENPSGGNNGGSGNENPSGGNGGSTGENETPSGGSEKPTDPTEPGAGTTYVVIYNGDIIEESLPERMWLYGVEKVNLEGGVDYTIDGKVITLTDSGYQKVLPLLGSSGGDGGQEVIPPVPDVPVPDVPGVEGTVYTVMYSGEEIATITASELSHFETVLTKDTDYTISETTITLTESGFNKLSAAGSGAGE